MVSDGAHEQEDHDDQAAEHLNDSFSENIDDRLSYDDLLKKVEELEKENATLKQLRENEGSKKRKLCEEATIKEGTSVMAKWNDGTFYPAKVQKAEIVYHVVFIDDGVKKKLKVDDIRLEM